MTLTAGIDVGGTSTKIVLLDGEEMVETITMPTAADLGATDALEAIAGAVHDLRGASPLVAAGVGLPALVEHGVVVTGTNLPGWDDAPARAILERALGVPVRVLMDSEAAAWGELLAGGHGDVTDLFVFTLGTGVGTAAVLRGCVFPGEGGLLDVGGRFGLEDGLSLEDVAAAGAIVGRVQQARRAAGRPLQSVEEIASAARAGDAACVAVCSLAGDVLGWAAAQVVQLLLVQRVVLTGGVAKADDLLLVPARRTFRRTLPDIFEGRSSLVTSTLGGLGGAIGAGLAARVG
jgi:glucokinase